MTKGLAFDPSGPTLEILDGARTVYKLGSQMVEMLTTEETFSAVTVAFGDLTKGNMIYWTCHSSVDFDGITFHNAEQGTSFITAPPQESDVTQDLMDVPAGADFFAGRLKLSRTAAPSTWMTRTIPCIPPQAVWMPFVGGASWLLEAEFGFARMLHLYIDSGAGKLRIGKQQSVSVAPAGTSQAAQSTGGPTIFDYWHVTCNSGGSGIPVEQRAQSNPSNYAMTGGPDGRADRGGANQPIVSDNTDYSSTYSVDIVGRFGRRTY